MLVSNIIFKMSFLGLITSNGAFDVCKHQTIISSCVAKYDRVHFKDKKEITIQ